MNEKAWMFPEGMELDVRLSAERGDRLIKVCVRSSEDHGADVNEPDPPLVRDAMPAFIAAVDAGLFRGPAEGQRAEVLNATARMREGERIDEWEILIPPLDVEALAVLARMFWRAGARAVSMKQDAPEARLTVRSFGEVARKTERTVLWEVDNELEEDHVAKDAAVMVCFERDAPPEIVEATHGVLRAWANVTERGGFRGWSYPASTAVLSEVGTELASEVFARFEYLLVGPDGWLSLWEGLSRIHRSLPILRVEMQ